MAQKLNWPFSLENSDSCLYGYSYECGNEMEVSHICPKFIVGGESK